MLSGSPANTLYGDATVNAANSAQLTVSAKRNNKIADKMSFIEIASNGGYEPKQVEQRQKRVNQAIAAGRFHLITSKPIVYLLPPFVYKTWQEHEQMIDDGKRKLLQTEMIYSYTYELVSDDGTKIIFDYEGDHPLTKQAEFLPRN